MPRSFLVEADCTHINFRWDNEMEGNEAYAVEQAARAVSGSKAMSDAARHYADKVTADMTWRHTYAKAFRYNAGLCHTGRCRDEHHTLAIWSPYIHCR